MQDLEAARLKVELANTKFDLKELRTKHAQRSEVSDDIARLRREYSEIRAALAKVELKMRQEETEISQDIARLKKEYAAVKADAAKWEKAHHETYFCLNNARAKNIDAEYELNRIRGELDKAKADIAEHSACSNTVFEQQETIKAQRNELVKVRGELAYTKDTLDWLRKEHANMSDEVRRLRNNPPRYPAWPAQDFYARS